MQSRAWMEVDLGALVRNARALMDRAGVPIIPMIKADAYGLGAVRVAAALESLDPAAYGIATVDEGIELRNAGIERAIIIFTPILEADYRKASEARIIPTLGSADSIARWSNFGGPYDLAIDTGMSRSGIPWRDIQKVAELVRRLPPRGAFTHFHSPALNDSSMDEQEERFAAAIALLHARPSELHTDSSGAITRHGRSKWDAVRPGIFMYGVGSGEGSAIEPENVVTVKSPIVETRWLEPGDTVSYDATWTAASRKRIATIALGYADGYPRNAGSGGVGIVGERVVPIAGRVTMDMIMLDVTDTDAGEGDVVTMIGSSSAAPIDAASVADLAGLSPYELLTGLRGRLTRIYRD